MNNIRNLIFGIDTPVQLKNGTFVPAINLDNGATTPPFKAVVEEIEKELLHYGSVGRGKGQKSAHTTEVYKKGRDAVKAFIGADDTYMTIYTNSTTDGMNKLASALIESPNDVILTTRMEHHAGDLPWRERAQVVYADVDSFGRLKMDHIKKLLQEYKGAIKYVAVTAASNVTGYVNDVHAIAKLAHQYGAKVVVDGAQIIAHQRFSMLGDTPDANIDFFVFSAHKMYSPFGGGAIIGLIDVLNKHLPAFYGGGMVKAVCDDEVMYLPPPDGYEAGCPNYPGVVGMIAAMKSLQEIGFDYIQHHEQQLLKRLLSGLQIMPNVILYGDSVNISDRLGIAVFNVQGISSSDVANYLANHHAIAVRHAAFCAHPYVRRLTEEKEKSATCAQPDGMVRVSFGVYNTEEEVDAFLSAIRQLSHSSIQSSGSLE